MGNIEAVKAKLMHFGDHPEVHEKAMTGWQVSDLMSKTFELYHGPQLLCPICHQPTDVIGTSNPPVGLTCQKCRCEERKMNYPKLPEKEEWKPKVDEWVWFQPSNEPAAYLVLISQVNNNYTYSFIKPHDGVIVPLKALSPATDEEKFRPGAKVRYEKPALKIDGYIKRTFKDTRNCHIKGVGHRCFNWIELVLTESAPDES